MCVGKCYVLSYRVKTFFKCVRLKTYIAVMYDTRCLTVSGLGHNPWLFCHYLHTTVFLDFKLSPCFERFTPSSGQSSGVWNVYADVSENSRQVGMKYDVFILHNYLSMKMEQSVPKRRHINFRRRGITQKKASNIQCFCFVKWTDLFSERLGLASFSLPYQNPLATTKNSHNSVPSSKA